MKPLHLLLFNRLSIFDQLKLEEALLRVDHRDWCIINRGSSPAIVMGISGQPENLLAKQRFKEAPLPLIRRYSGGGTVVIDEDTLFLSWILNHGSTPAPPFPKEVMRWTTSIVQSMLAPLPITLEESDYVFSNRKCGGNAQYFTKTRFVHHTSFLWNYRKEQMEYLLLPPKMPSYRNQRDHADFLHPLAPYFSSLDGLVEQIISRLQCHFSVEIASQSSAEEVKLHPCRISTEYLTWI